MRRKEIAEIRKQFSLENCNITRIDTTLITQGEITTRQQQTFLNLDNDDLLKYLGIFKKTLSGELGKNLLNLKFRAPEPEMSWGFLQQIRDSGLKDEDLIVSATESIKEKLVCCLIDFQLNNAECFFIDKATERGDAVASLSEVNAVRWENRQVI